jgi:hypothetical protein
MRSIMLLCCAAAAIAAASPLDVIVSANGSYTIEVNGKLWFESGPTFVTVAGARYTTANNTLVLKSSRKISGTGDLGVYTGTALSWTAGSTPFETSFYVYAKTASVIFETVFPNGIPMTGKHAADKEELLSSFPSILMSESAATDSGEGITKGRLTFNGRFMEASLAQAFSSTDPNFRPDVSTGLYAGPCAIFDRKMDNVVMFSPFNEFMAASFGKEQADYTNNKVALETGLMGSFTSVPKGFTYKAIMKLGIDPALPGVTGAVKEWGTMMLKQYGKTSSIPQDVSLHKLGFSTDK